MSSDSGSALVVTCRLCVCVYAAGMEMMQMPMMMFSQVMMMFQQQAMTLMMAVMMLPSMLEMLPMVTEQVKSLMGRSTRDPITGQTIPAVNYVPPPWKTRVGRKIERRLYNLCNHVAVLGPILEFGCALFRTCRAPKHHPAGWPQSRAFHDTFWSDKSCCVCVCVCVCLMPWQAQDGGVRIPAAPGTELSRLE